MYIFEEYISCLLEFAPNRTFKHVDKQLEYNKLILLTLYHLTCKVLMSVRSCHCYHQGSYVSSQLQWGNKGIVYICAIVLELKYKEDNFTRKTSSRGRKAFSKK